VIGNRRGIVQPNGKIGGFGEGRRRPRGKLKSLTFDAGAEASVLTI
jgi:hypothetical protein